MHSVLRFLIPVSLTALCLSAAGQGKVDSFARFQASFFLEGGFTTADFSRNMDSDGFGMGGEGLVAVSGQGPMWLGLSVHTFAFDTKATTYTEYIDGLYFEFRERTTSRLFMLHAAVRFQPVIDFLLQPYFQIQGGYNQFFTNTKIRDVDLDDVVDRIHEQGDAVLGYGVACGLRIVPSDPLWSIDIRASYLGNASAEYLVYDEDLDSGQLYPIETFDERKSPVALVGILVGASFTF